MKLHNSTQGYLRFKKTLWRKLLFLLIILGNMTVVVELLLLTNIFYPLYLVIVIAYSNQNTISDLLLLYKLVKYIACTERMSSDLYTYVYLYRWHTVSQLSDHSLRICSLPIDFVCTNVAIAKWGQEN